MAPGEASAEVERDSYYQVSTYGRLSEGGYQGMISIDRLLEHGDFGIGTVEGIDGEMMVLNGVAYRAGTDLVPVEVPAGTLIPFAMLTYFDDMLSYQLNEELNYTAFKDRMEDVLQLYLSTPHDRCRVRFDHHTERAGAAGALSAWWTLWPTRPPCAWITSGNDDRLLYLGRLGEINVPGFHMHFLSQDLSYGGHVLDAEFSGIAVNVDPIRSYAILVTDGVIA
jgi:acetolactate decarboxylase